MTTHTASAADHASSASSNDSVVLDARNLAVGPVGGTPAADGVSLRVVRGEWIAITGPNGSGKTSLGLALAGLVRPLGGTITRAARRIATILQEPASQLSQRTVLDEVAFTALNLGVTEPRAFEVARLWAERFGLGALLDRAPHALSAGEQQRVLLAAALAIEPDLLIADEPAAHLDPRSRTRALDLVAAEVARGMAVAWITQEPAEVEWASRRIAIGAADSPPSFLPADEMRSPAFRRTEPAPSHGVRVRVDPGGLRISVESPIEFEIDGPGVWVLRGANGSGKTSLLEHLAGLVVLPEVQVSGAPAGGLPPILAPQYADRHVFEDRVRDEVLYGARRREGDLRAIEADLATWLSLLGRTAELLERRTWELSAGDRRLVSVLAALATPASWILLDEPTCGLDAERRIGMAQIVREVARRAPTVVATQDRAWDMTLGGREVLIGSEPSDPGEESPKNAKSQQKNGLTRPCNTT